MRRGADLLERRLTMTWKVWDQQSEVAWQCLAELRKRGVTAASSMKQHQRRGPWAGCSSPATEAQRPWAGQLQNLLLKTGNGLDRICLHG